MHNEEKTNQAIGPPYKSLSKSCHALSLVSMSHDGNYVCTKCKPPRFFKDPRALEQHQKDKHKNNSFIVDSTKNNAKRLDDPLIQVYNEIKESLKKIGYEVDRLTTNKVEVDENPLQPLENMMPRLRQLRPYCKDLGPDYDNRQRAYKSIVEKFVTYINEQISKLGKIKEVLESQRNTANQYVEELRLLKEQLNLLSSLNQSSQSNSLSNYHGDCEKQLAEVEGRLNSHQDSIDESLRTIHRYLEMARGYQQELNKLCQDTHDWEDIQQDLPLQDAKPDEIRQVTKTVGRRCTICGIEIRYANPPHFRSS